MDDDLRLVAKFDDKASAGVRKLGKDLAGVKPTHGMAQAQKWFAEFRGEADKTAKIVRPISGYMGAIGVGGLAAGFSIGEMVKQFRELANQTIALKEIGRQTGLTTTEVKRLKYAASELSIDPEKMVAGLRTMSDKMYDFHRRTGDLYGLLNQFDPQFGQKLLGDTDPQEELKDIVGWLAKIPQQQRAIGKSAADATQIQRRWTEAFLGDGDLSRIAATPGEFAKAMADAAKAVPEVTKAMEDQAKLLNQAVVNLDQSWDNLKNDVGPSVIHGMTEATDKLREAFDAIHKHPAEAGIAAASAGALYARYRVMRAMSGTGGAAMNRAAGELTGAAAKQGSAGTSLLEAATALKEAAVELRGRGGGGAPGGATEPGGSGEPGKPGGSSPGYGSLGFQSMVAFMNLGMAALDAPDPTTPEGQARINANIGAVDDINKRASDATGGFFAQPGQEDTIRPWVKDLFGGFTRALGALDPIGSAHAEGTPPSGVPVSPHGAWTAPTAYDREARARARSQITDTDGNALHRHDDEMSPVTAQELFQKVRQGSVAKPDDDHLPHARSQITDTDGNALHRHDDEMSPVTAQELFQKVRQGSKEGIVAGLREMAQEQELGNGAGDAGHGLPSIRYGRSPASGGYRRTPGQKYDLSDGGSGSKTPIASGLFKAKAPGIAARLKQDFPGLTDEDTAAVLGNLGHESAGFKAFEEGGHGPGRGWAQWTDPGRKARFFEYAKEHQLDPHSDDANYGFLRWELTHTHKAAIEALKRAHGLRDKTRAFEGIFEGAGVKAYASRDRYADAALAAIRGAGPTATVPVPAGTSPKAISDAEVFAARQRMVAGGTNAKDQALVQEYLKQQNSPKPKPQAHASGGPIRGPGGPRSDSIFAMLSNGEFVVNARDAKRHAELLHAVNSGGLPAYADGGLVASGPARRRSWLDFFHRPTKDGGMGATRPVAFGATAMMMGESGRSLNPTIYHWDVNGPSGGTAQWHDVTKGPGAGKLHRLSDLAAFAIQQHEDWSRSVPIQQAWWKREATGSMRFAWDAMRRAKTAAGALKAGIDKFEVPADKLGELHKRLPNIVALAREAGGGAAAREVDPIRLDIHHHQDGRVKSIRSKAGRGVHVHLARGPTFASASETD